MKAKQLLMRAKELRDFLNDIPDDAEILIECEHGDSIESGCAVVVSRSEIEGNDYEAMMFEYDNWRDCYDEDYVDEYPVDGQITAVLIHS